MRQWVICICFLITWIHHVDGQQGYFRETELLQSALRLMMDLQIEQALSVCEQSRLQDPDNLLVEHVAAYADFITAFITEGEEELAALEITKGARLAILQEGDPTSPYFHFSQAELHLQWAIARSKHGAYIRAGWDINKAYKLLKKCKDQHPDFILADKSLSVIHALIGSISGIQKGVIKLFTALDGSIDQGLQEINQLYNKSETQSSMWHMEVAIIRSLMALHVERDTEAALAYLMAMDVQMKESRLAQYFIGATLQKLGRSQEAQAYLCKSNESNRLRFDYMDLQCGICKLNALDKGADVYIKRFVDHFQGINYISEAYQKLAWYELVIADDVTGYRKRMTDVTLYGKREVGEDEQAWLEAEAGDLPHRGLLMTRLSYDGGYYHAALEKLVEIDIKTLDGAQTLEYYYRAGRLYQALNRAEEAIFNFTQAIHLGTDERIYYACNSALQMAEIFRNEGDLISAKHYYESCLDISPSTYAKTLHQRARLGLEFIEAK